MTKCGLKSKNLKSCSVMVKWWLGTSFRNIPPPLLFHSTTMESVCLDLASLKTLMSRPVENFHFPSVLENGLSVFKGYKGTKRKRNVLSDLVAL